MTLAVATGRDPATDDTIYEIVTTSHQPNSTAVDAALSTVNFWIHALSDEVLVWLSACSEVQIACMWFSRCYCIPKTRNLLHHLNPDWFNLSSADLARLSCKRGP